MASQMIVAPSKDTLFMRGFSSRKDVEDIREFFEKEARGKVLIEFLKQTDTDDRLYVALKFESKEVAKEILNRYDNTDVLGDRITLSWFKDLRRARAKVADRRSRYDTYDRGYDNRYDRRYDTRRMDTRNRVKPRRYLERSISRSPSYSRSRSRSRDRRDHSRSVSPPTKHKLKSAVEVQASGKHKVDDSDNERSSPLKESSMSPRAYSPDAHSGSEDEEADRKQDSRGKKGLHDDDLDRTDTSSGRKRGSSYDDGRHPDDKYSRQQQQTKSQLPSRYAGDFEERELLESRWTRNNPLDPSPDVSEPAADRHSLSLERERVSLDTSLGVGHAGERPGSDQPGRQATGGAAGLDERRRMYEYEGGVWDGQRRTVYTEAGQQRDSFEERKDSRKLTAAEADRWLGIDSPSLQGVGRWPAGQKEGGTEQRGPGWSSQTMSMIQEKKEDIERVYKNDCETFVGVVKMLISKDPMLEERLQPSLRENLKDIGQRCILELREFIDRLRDKEESQLGAM